MLAKQNESHQCYSLLNGPVEGVEREDAHLVFVVAVGAARQEELHKLRDMGPKKGYFLAMKLRHRNTQPDITHEDKQNLQDVK